MIFNHNRLLWNCLRVNIINLEHLSNIYFVLKVTNNHRKFTTAVKQNTNMQNNKGIHPEVDERMTLDIRYLQMFLHLLSETNLIPHSVSWTEKIEFATSQPPNKCPKFYGKIEKYFPNLELNIRYQPVHSEQIWQCTVKVFRHYLLNSCADCQSPYSYR